MKTLLVTVLAALLLVSCGSEPEKPKTLCENPCLNDTLKYTADNPAKPFMNIIVSNCLADTVIWGHKYLPTYNAIHLSTFMDGIIQIGTNTIKGYIIDTTMAVLKFNDCGTRRGYWLKLPFNKSLGQEKSVSAFNNFDPRYSIDDDLLCYKAKNTIYVDNIRTGKQVTIEIEKPELDYQKMYDIVDSINITKTRFYMRLNDGGSEMPVEKTIDL